LLLHIRDQKMPEPTFESVVETTIVSLRTANGLGAGQLDVLLLALDRERRHWRSLQAIPKPLVHALIVLRDNVVGARNHYRDTETLDRISQAESAIERFIDDTLP